MDILPDDWIPTRWERKADLANCDALGVSISITASPFYSGYRFAVRRLRYCLSSDSRWCMEPIPSSRTDGFYERFRFRSIREALAALTRAEASGAWERREIDSDSA